MSSGFSSGQLASFQSNVNPNTNAPRRGSRTGVSESSAVKKGQGEQTEAEEARQDQAERRPEDQKRVEAMVETLNEVVGFLNRDIEFNALPEQDVFQAEVINSKTKEVIKKIPRDDTIKLQKKMDIMLGMMIDELR